MVVVFDDLEKLRDILSLLLLRLYINFIFFVVQTQHFSMLAVSEVFGIF